MSKDNEKDQKVQFFVRIMINAGKIRLEIGSSDLNDGVDGAAVNFSESSFFLSTIW